ncbi:hypothetical protein DQ04_03931020 [Trypanosoma grayi]|uniref:hypothetical protein n=1 Tax=Trypanosoma grayi TaxID=71804 RepID=UPI0004F4A7A2|nr:hypothetical protein DQ04_03931020 [Trypanosoma grayi]KEG10284.1 hypothetical protein DQ04_03931020 [Trypanosoma grayi]
MGLCGSVGNGLPQPGRAPLGAGVPPYGRPDRRRWRQPGFDMPFAGYDPDTALYSTGSRAKAVPRRSVSIAVLQKVIADRESQKNGGNDDPFSLSYSSKPPAQDKKRASVAARTRRMSGIMNEFSSQMDNLLSRVEDEDVETYLRRAFSLLDVHCTEMVSQEDLLKGLGKLRSEESIRTMFAAADGNKDGYLDWEEFSKFFRYLKGSDCVLADSADLDSALEKYMTNTSPQPSPSRHRLYDVKVVNLPSQSGRIKCVAMSLDLDLYAVTHRNDCTVHLYTSAGVEVRQLTGHSDSLLGIAFSPDKKYIATASRDWTMILWDSTAGQLVQCVQHEGVVTAVAFSYNGKLLYTGCQDNRIRKLTVPKGRMRAVLKDLPNRQSGVIVSLASQHTKNEWVVLSRSCDKNAYVVDAQQLSTFRLLGGHDGIVWHTRYNPDDTFILTCCEKKLNVWNAESFTIFSAFDSKSLCAGVGGALCTAAVYFPVEFDNLLMVFTSRRQFYVLNVDTREILLDFTLRAPVYAAACDFSGYGLVCGDDYGNVYNIKVV